MMCYILITKNNVQYISYYFQYLLNFFLIKTKTSFFTLCFVKKHRIVLGTLNIYNVYNRD